MKHLRIVAHRWQVGDISDENYCERPFVIAFICPVHCGGSAIGEPDLLMNYMHIGRRKLFDRLGGSECQPLIVRRSLLSGILAIICHHDDKRVLPSLRRLMLLPISA